MPGPGGVYRKRKKDKKKSSKRNWGQKLLEAAREGDLVKLEKALKHINGHVDDCRNEYGNTALMIAAARGRTECVQVLLDAGTEINKKNSFGGNALSRAAFNTHLECMRILFDVGGSIKIDHWGVWYILINLISKGHFEYAVELAESDPGVESGISLPLLLRFLIMSDYADVSKKDPQLISVINQKKIGVLSRHLYMQLL